MCHTTALGNRPHCNLLRYVGLAVLGPRTAARLRKSHTECFTCLRPILYHPSQPGVNNSSTGCRCDTHHLGSRVGWRVSAAVWLAEAAPPTAWDPLAAPHACGPERSAMPLSLGQGKLSSAHKLPVSLQSVHEIELVTPFCRSPCQLSVKQACRWHLWSKARILKV